MYYFPSSKSEPRNWYISSAKTINNPDGTSNVHVIVKKPNSAPVRLLQRGHDGATSRTILVKVID